MTTTTPTPLLPCPFCGKQPVTHYAMGQKESEQPENIRCLNSKCPLLGKVLKASDWNRCAPLSRPVVGELPEGTPETDAFARTLPKTEVWPEDLDKVLEFCRSLERTRDNAISVKNAAVTEYDWILKENESLRAPVPGTPEQVEAQPVAWTEAKIIECLIEAGCLDTVKMSFEAGPLCVTRPSVSAERLVAAIAKRLTRPEPSPMKGEGDGVALERLEMIIANAPPYRPQYDGGSDVDEAFQSGSDCAWFDAALFAREARVALRGATTPQADALAHAISDIENAKAIRESDPHFTRDLQDLDSPWILLQAYKSLRESLTPSDETKAAYMGGFSVPLPERDDDGNEHIRRINVPWTTIKEIMQAIRSRAAPPVNHKGEA